MKLLEVKKLSKTAIAPTRAYNNDAGLDLYADEDSFIEIGHTKIIKTNIAVNILPGYYGKIFTRSSYGSKGLTVLAGVIDSGYTGSLDVVMHNLSNRSSEDDVLLTKGYKVKKGDKIAQLIIQKIETPSVEVVESFSNEGFGARGIKGFGSSNR